MNIEFLEIAVAELDDAFNSIQSLPQTWPKMGQYHRRFILSRFPYSVIYKNVDETTIYVVVIMHNHRNPHGPALALLNVVAKEPQAVLRALG